MTIFGPVVRWLRGQPIWAEHRDDPGDCESLELISLDKSDMVLHLAIGGL